MVLSAANAYILTTNTITLQSELALSQEVGLAEQAIRNASGRQLFRVIYNARLIGNPPGDPIRATLTADQQNFYDSMTSAGFQVRMDQRSGFWLFRWNILGAETLVRVYRIRTTVSPGSVRTQTIAAIKYYFTSLVPSVTSRASIWSSNGGDISESDFGGTNSVFYEYTAVANQPDRTDHRTGIRAALVAAGLGYQRGSYNVAVYKVS